MTEAKFWANVAKVADGCWEWRACRNHDGYGMVRYDGRMRRAHRVSYEMRFGSILHGLQLDHLCRNRGCVNPEHLEPVTSRENSHRSPLTAATLNASKTLCHLGHALVSANVFITNDGRRNCRTCRRHSQLRSYYQGGKARRKERKEPQP